MARCGPWAALLVPLGCGGAGDPIALVGERLNGHAGFVLVLESPTQVLDVRSLSAEELPSFGSIPSEATTVRVLGYQSPPEELFPTPGRLPSVPDGEALPAAPLELELELSGPDAETWRPQPRSPALQAFRTQLRRRCRAPVEVLSHDLPVLGARIAFAAPTEPEDDLERIYMTDLGERVLVSEFRAPERLPDVVRPSGTEGVRISAFDRSGGAHYYFFENGRVLRETAAPSTTFEVPRGAIALGSVRPRFSADEVAVVTQSGALGLWDGIGPDWSFTQLPEVSILGRAFLRLTRITGRVAVLLADERRWLVLEPGRPLTEQSVPGAGRIIDLGEVAPNYYFELYTSTGETYRDTSEGFVLSDQLETAGALAARTSAQRRDGTWTTWLLTEAGVLTERLEGESCPSIQLDLAPEPALAVEGDRVMVVGRSLDDGRRRVVRLRLRPE